MRASSRLSVSDTSCVSATILLPSVISSTSIGRFWTKTSSSMIGSGMFAWLHVPQPVQQLLDQRIGPRLPGTIKGHALNRVTLDDQLHSSGRALRWCEFRSQLLFVW